MTNRKDVALSCPTVFFGWFGELQKNNMQLAAVYMSIHKGFCTAFTTHAAQ